MMLREILPKEKVYEMYQVAELAQLERMERQGMNGQDKNKFKTFSGMVDVIPKETKMRALRIRPILKNKNGDKKMRPYDNDEVLAIEILKDVKKSLEKNQLTEYASYAFVGHQIAFLLDKQLIRLNEMNQLQQKDVFSHFMERKMKS
jgi:hypothetical protein